MPSDGRIPAVCNLPVHLMAIEGAELTDQEPSPPKPKDGRPTTDVAHDPSLSEFVAEVNDIEEYDWDDVDAVGIALTVGGVMVKGNVVPNWRYSALLMDAFDRQAERVDGGAGDDDVPLGYKDPRSVSTFRIFFSGAGPGTEYVHLIDAQHCLPIGWYPDGGTLWRGKLSAVDGWSFDPMDEFEHVILDGRQSDDQS